MERDDLDRGLSLFERQGGVGLLDAVPAATPVARGAEALVTADAAFRVVPKLPVIVLEGAEIDRLVGDAT